MQKISLLKCLDLWLPGIPKPKKNSQQIRRTKLGKPFITSGNDHKAWEIEMLWHLKTQGVRSPIKKCSEIVISYEFPDLRRRDLTNLTDSVMDLLVKAQIITDDCWTVTGKVTMIPSVGNGDTKVKIFYELPIN